MRIQLVAKDDYGLYFQMTPS